MSDHNSHTTKTVTTKDGSHSLYSEQFGQHYHNPNGAVAESRHVFFETPGLIDRMKQSQALSVFETGFGTGLNLLLLLDYHRRLSPKVPLIFQSVEAFPISSDTFHEFNYGQFLEFPEITATLAEIFETLSPGRNDYCPRPNIKITIYQQRFETLNLPRESVNAFFHDPFSPEVNKELWSDALFGQLAEMSDTKAILATYCAASKARAAMAMAGWYLAKAKGALGKREMTLAAREEQTLAGHKRVNEQRLIDRWHAGDFE